MATVELDTSSSFLANNTQIDGNTITADSVVGVVGVTAARSLGTTMRITDNSPGATTLCEH